MANPVDPVLSHLTSQERQPAAVIELANDHQSPKHSHAEDHTEQIEATSGDDQQEKSKLQPWPFRFLLKVARGFGV